MSATGADATADGRWPLVEHSYSRLIVSLPVGGAEVESAFGDLLRAHRIPARITSQDRLGRSVASARVLADEIGNPLAVDGADDGVMSWRSVRIDELAPRLVDRFGVGLLVGDRVWDGGGQVDPRRLGAHPDAAVARLADGAALDTLAFAGRIDRIGMRLMSRLSGLPFAYSEDGSGRAAAWAVQTESAQAWLWEADALTHRQVCLFRLGAVRGFAVGLRRTTATRLWVDDDGTLVDPVPGWWRDRDGRSVTELLPPLDAGDPNAVVTDRRLDREAASTFRALWRERSSDERSFARLAAALGLAPVAAEAAEGPGAGGAGGARGASELPPGAELLAPLGVQSALRHAALRRVVLRLDAALPHPHPRR